MQENNLLKTNDLHSNVNDWNKITANNLSLPPLFFGSRLVCRCFDRIDSLFRWNRIFMRSLGCIIVNLVNSGMSSSSATTNNSCVITFNPYWVINLTLLCSALLTLYYYAASGVFFRGRAGGKRDLCAISAFGHWLLSFFPLLCYVADTRSSQPRWDLCGPIHTRLLLDTIAWKKGFTTFNNTFYTHSIFDFVVCASLLLRCGDREPIRKGWAAHVNSSHCQHDKTEQLVLVRHTLSLWLE